jgi:glycosyltransferase involved in cell wall biosynthesis
LTESQIPVRFLDARSLRDVWTASTRLRTLWRREPPDLIQSFLFHANVLSGLVCPPRTPLVLGVRVADPRPWRSWIERRIARHGRNVVCVSQEVARQLRRRGFSPPQLHVIPNGIEVSRYQGVAPADLSEVGISAERRIWLVIGRLEHQKGLDWLMKLAPPLLKNHPTHDLVLIGDGPERSALLRQIQQLQLTHRIHLLGWRPDIPSLLARGELLLLPSRYEGMPNVVLEAMAAGKPVVASRVEGVAELLGHDVDLQTVPAGDSEAFLRRVASLTESLHLRNQLGQNNLQNAVQRFSVERMLRAYRDLYRQLRP